MSELGRYVMINYVTKLRNVSNQGHEMVAVWESRVRRAVW